MSDPSFGKKSLNVLILIAIITFLGAMVVHAYVGTFARYMADDYCTASVFQVKGLLGAQKEWYLTWSGRYAFYFFVNLTEYGGLGLAPMLPSLAILLLLAAGIFKAWQGIRVLRVSSVPLLSIGWATLLLYVALDSTPNILESLYWRTGMLTYVAPLIVFSFQLGIFLNRGRKGTARIGSFWLILSFLMALVAGGFSESFAAMQFVALLLIMAAYLARAHPSERRRMVPLVGMALLGAGLALFVVALAPGNQVRQAFFPAPPRLLSLLTASSLYALEFIVSLVNQNFRLVCLALTLPLVTAFVVQRVAWLRLRAMVQLFWAVPVTLVVLLMAFAAPAFYGMSIAPPSRAEIIPHYVVFSQIIIFGYIIGAVLRQFWQNLSFKPPENFILVPIYLMIAFLLVVGPVASVRNLLKVSEQAKEYAVFWDLRDAEIRAAQRTKVADVTVPALPIDLGFAVIGDNPDYWVNRCAAGYYGLDTLVAH